MVAISMDGRLILRMVLSIIFLLSSTVLAETIEIPGSGAPEAILNELASAFNKQNPEHKVIIPPSVGSEGGIRLVGKGESVLARVARPIKEEEKKYGLNYLAFAIDPVIFAAGGRVGVKNLTTSQIADIFSGKVKNWKEVGGREGTIRVLVREHADSSLVVIKQHIPAFEKIVFPANAKLLFQDYEMAEMLDKYKFSIGWLTLSTLSLGKSSFSPLAVDGVMPTRDNVASGRYKMLGVYALVYKEKKLSPSSKGFIDFIFSDSGRQILEKSGLVPHKRR